MLQSLTTNRPTQVARYLILSLFFLIVSSAISIGTAAIPCLDWPTPDAAAFYRVPRFSIGALIFFLLHLVLGVVYTTRVVIFWNATLWKEKRNWVAVLVCGSALYFIGPIFVLNGQCDDTEHFGDVALQTWLRFVPCFIAFQYFAQFWTLLDHIEGMGDIALNMRFIRRWKRKQWLTVAFGLSVGMAAGAYDMYLLATIDRLQWYMAAFFGIIIGFFMLAWLLRARYSVHIHHYCIGLLAPFFPVHESVFSIFMQAIFIGISIEGFSRWGPDPIFIPHEAKPESLTQSLTPVLIQTQHSPIVTAEAIVVIAPTGAGVETA